MAPHRNRSVTRCNNTDNLHSPSDQKTIQQRTICQNRKQFKSLSSDQQLVTAIWNNKPLCAILQPLICGERRAAELKPQPHPTGRNQRHIGNQTWAPNPAPRQKPDVIQKRVGKTAILLQLGSAGLKLSNHTPVQKHVNNTVAPSSVSSGNGDSLLAEEFSNKTVL